LLKSSVIKGVVWLNSNVEIIATVI
jgi:hypothetical protein